MTLYYLWRLGIDVNGTHLFIAAHDHYTELFLFFYTYLFLDIFTTQEYLDLEYSSFHYKT